MRKIKEYAVYKGENLLCIGTAKEIAKELNVKEDTVYFWSYPTNKKRESLKTRNRKIAVKLDEDEV